MQADGFEVVGIDIRDADVLADLSKPEERSAAVATVLEKTGGRIDRLVLSAGLGELHPLPTVTSVNYFGSIRLLDAFQDALGRGEDPAAVLLCSNSARMTTFEGHPYVEALLDEDLQAAGSSELERGREPVATWHGASPSREATFKPSSLAFEPQCSSDWVQREHWARKAQFGHGV